MNRALTVVIAITAIFAVLIAILSATANSEDSDPGLRLQESEAPNDAKFASSNIKREAATETQRAPVAAPTDVPLATGSIRYRGSVIVTDAQGIEHTREAGSITFQAAEKISDSGSFLLHTSEATVAAGEFTMEAVAGRLLSVSKLILGERPAHVIGEPVIKDDQIEIRASWYLPTILRVVDIETGKDLSGVLVVSQSEWQMRSLAHPGLFQGKDVRAEGQDSPVELYVDVDSISYPYEDSESVRIGATGYTWASLDIDFKAGARHRIELQRSGTLEVTIVGTLSAPANSSHQRKKSPREDDTRPKLRLRKPVETPELPDIETAIEGVLKEAAQMQDTDFPGGRRPTETELREMYKRMYQRVPLGKLMVETRARVGDPIVLEGIQPGQYTIQVELGKSWDGPAVLGTSTVQVIAGVRERVTIRVEPPKKRATVPLSGTLFFPLAWKDRDLTLHFRPINLIGKTSDDEHSLRLSEMSPDPQRPGLYRWNAGRVTVCQYSVTSYSPATQWIIDTGPLGLDDAELIVGEPAEVSVRVVETKTGIWVEEDSVTWNCERPSLTFGGSIESATFDKNSRTHRFRAPAGRIQVDFHSLEYSVTGKSLFVIVPGKNELEISVRRNCGVKLTLVSQGKERAWDQDSAFDIKLESADGIEVFGMCGGSIDSKAFSHTVPRPGTYTVTTPQQPGYEAVPPFKVNIGEGEFLDHRIELRERR